MEKKSWAINGIGLYLCLNKGKIFFSDDINDVPRRVRYSEITGRIIKKVMKDRNTIIELVRIKE